MGRKLVRRNKGRTYRAGGRLKSVIKSAIRQNELKKVERKRLLGILGQDISIKGHFWSMFGRQSGQVGQDSTTPLKHEFEIVMFQGVSAVGTNQTQFDNEDATFASVMNNYPSNMNLSMIGDECFIESATIRYRLYNTSVLQNYTARVCIIETYTALESTLLSEVFEYPHVNYKSGVAPWTGRVLASINRRRVKRVYHDRTYNVTASAEPNAILSRVVHLRINKKLIAPVAIPTQSSGFSELNVGNALTTLKPLPDGLNPYPEAQQKELLTPHIYIFCMTDEVVADPTATADVSIQACWSVRYTDQ